MWCPTAGTAYGLHRPARLTHSLFSMETKSVWKRSVLFFFFFYFKAFGNSLDVQPSVTTKLKTMTDDEKTTKHVTTALPLDIQHTNEITGYTAITTTVTFMNLDNDGNKTNSSVETTSASPSTYLTTNSRTRRTNNPKPTWAEEIKWDDKWDEPFKYDYSSLRQAGLTIAAVLFMLGIMVIACGKIRCSRRCHTGKGRSYEVTRM